MRTAGGHRASRVAALLCLLVAMRPAIAHYLDVDEAVVRPGALSVGIALSGKPFAYSEDGRLRGFEIEAARAVAEAHGLELRAVRLPRDRLAAALRDGEVDAINTLALERAPPATRTVPYLVVGDHAMVLRGNPFRVHGLRDLAGRTVSATSGSSAERYALALNEELRARGLAPMNVHSFPYQRDTSFPVDMGHAAAYFIQSVSAVGISRDPESRTTLLEGLFRPRREVGLAVRADNPALYHAVEHALAAMVATGRYGKLRERWGIPAVLSPFR